VSNQRRERWSAVKRRAARVAFNQLNQQSVDTLGAEKNMSLRPVITQFGWQFEHRLYTNDDGITKSSWWLV
jgi:hypothetical protein